MVIATVAVFAGIVLAVVFTARGRRGAAEALLVLAVFWLPVNKPVELRILWTFAPGHGVVVADLLSIVLVAYAAWKLRHHVVAARPERTTLPRHAGRADVDELLFGMRTLDLDDPALDRDPPAPTADLDHDAGLPEGSAPRRSRLRGRGEDDGNGSARGRGAA